jgi:predicted nucleic acid-binding protein
MGSYYFDTSAVIKLYVPEAGSAWVEHIVTQRGENGFAHIIAFVKIGIVETAAALTRRQRLGDITPAERSQLYASFMRDAERRYVTLAVDDQLLLHAAELTQHHLLRGYDAVHLAGALTFSRQLTDAGLPGLTFASADESLCDVARAEGLVVENPNAYGGE